MAEREVRYCTTDDGIRIAYCVVGRGPPLIVCPQFVESFSLDHIFRCTSVQRVTRRRTFAWLFWARKETATRWSWSST